MRVIYIITIFATKNMDKETKQKKFDDYISSFVPESEKEKVLYDLHTVQESFFKGFEAGEEQFRWISVKDEIPEEEFDDGYTFVFVRVKTNIGYLIETDYIRNGRWELHQTQDKVVTHWMRIPLAGLKDVEEDEVSLEETKSFSDLADSVTPFSPEFTEDFCKYMEESVRESRRNAAEAERSARDIIIF